MRSAAPPRRERGAVLVLTGIVLSVLLAFTSIALDLGYQRVARRDMQALADVVALDMVRMVDGRTVAVIEADPLWLEGRDESVARNVDTQGDDPVVTPILGTVDPATRVFTPMTGSQVPNAVKVIARTEVDYFFRPGTGGAARSAVAGAGDEPMAGVQIGTKLASLSTSSPSYLNPLLTQLLGAGNPPLDLDLVGYQGLAAANVNLGLIAGALGFGSVDALLSAPDVSVADLFRMSAEVLGVGTPAAVSLNAFAARIENVDVRLGDLITVADGNENAAADASISLFDLLLGSAQLANRTQFVSVPGLTLGIPGLVSSTLRLRVIEPPQFAFGPVGMANGQWVTRATTAQIETQLDTSIFAESCVVVIVSICNRASLSLPIRLGAAEGSASLTNIECAGTAPTQVDVLGETTGVTATAATTLTVVLANINIPLPPILTANVPIAGATRSFEFHPPFHPSAPQAMAATGLGLSTALVADLQLLGLVDVGAVLALLNPVLAELDSKLLDPLFKDLGLSVAGADVRTLSATCNGGNIALVG